MDRRDVIVIGGGAAGMLAALFALRGGAKVTLLEKNEKLGKKVYITGKGRCNCTNLCDTEDFLREVPRNPRFLYRALKLMDPESFLHLLNELGCPTKVERGRRAFPVSDRASDVTRALEKGILRLGGEIRLRAGAGRGTGQRGNAFFQSRDRVHRRAFLSLHRLHRRRLRFRESGGPCRRALPALPDGAGNAGSLAHPAAGPDNEKYLPNRPGLW